MAEGLASLLSNIAFWKLAVTILFRSALGRTGLEAAPESLASGRAFDTPGMVTRGGKVY